jgi:cold shock protein
MENKITEELKDFDKGTIKKIFMDKKFGFIRRESKKDVFFHADNVEGINFEELRDGDLVKFTIKEDDKGLNAYNVTLINK